MKTQINPGYGYRMLERGEKIQAGDEYRIHDGTWKAHPTWRQNIGIYNGTAEEGGSWLPHRRKLRVPTGVPPKGYEFLIEGDTVTAGDCFLRFREDNNTRGGQIFSVSGESFWIGHKVGNHSGDFEASPFIRKVSQPEPAIARQNAESVLQDVRFESALKVLNTVRANLKTPYGESLRLHAANVMRKLEQTQQTLDQTEDALDTAEQKLVALEKEIQRGRIYSDTQTREIAELKAKLAAMQKNASGNAVLVRKDGFSLPRVAPTAFIQGEKQMPSRSTLTGFGTVLQFQRTEDKDGFGRVIYREVA